MYAFTQTPGHLGQLDHRLHRALSGSPAQAPAQPTGRLLVYELVNTLAGRLQRHLPGGARAGSPWPCSAPWWELLTLFFVWFTSFIIQEVQNPGRLWTSSWCSPSAPAPSAALAGRLPAGQRRQHEAGAGEWVRAHVAQLQLFGRDAARTFVIVLIGMILSVPSSRCSPTPIPSACGRCPARCWCVSAWWPRPFATSSSPRSRSRCSTPP